MRRNLRQLPVQVKINSFISTALSVSTPTGVDLAADLIWVTAYIIINPLITCSSSNSFLSVRKSIEYKWFVRCILDKCKRAVFLSYNTLLHAQDHRESVNHKTWLICTCMSLTGQGHTSIYICWQLNPEYLCSNALSFFDFNVLNFKTNYNELTNCK